MLKALCFNPKVSLSVIKTSIFTSSGVRCAVELRVNPSCRIEAPLLENSEVLSSPLEIRRKRARECTVSVPENTNLSPVSGVPKEHITSRRVRIYKPTKNAMQEGSTNTRGWEMEFDSRQRWVHPLLSWTASADPLGAVKLFFRNPEEAIDHCTKNGWNWYVDEAKAPTPKKKNYADNFSWNRRTRVGTR